MTVAVKKTVVFFGFAVLLLMPAGMALGEDGKAPEETGTLQSEIIIPTENEGVTSANVRLWFADTESNRRRNYDYILLDLSRFSHYHELALEKDDSPSIFTTEATVRGFSFFRIMMNEDFFGENRDENARRYVVQDTLYFLDEFTPEVPFVVRGPILGSIFAAYGFSFLDETGAARYFSIELDGRTGLVGIYEF